MIRLVSAVSVLLAAGAASVTFAQLPKFDTAPGKWSYNTRTEIPGMGSIPMSFEQCVTQKDIDEGRNLNSQKEAGMDCKYQDVKVTGNRYQFTAVCTGKNLPEPIEVHALRRGPAGRAWPLGTAFGFRFGTEATSSTGSIWSPGRTTFDQYRKLYPT